MRYTRQWRKACRASALGGLLALSALTGQPAGAQERPASFETTTLKVVDFRVKGNTLLTDAELEAVLAPFKGQELTLQKLREVADKLTDAYATKGYFTVRALLPEQKIADGIVELRVLQGKLGQVKVDGAEGYSPEFVKWYMEPALEKEYLDKKELERAVLLLNEFPGLKASTVLEAGEKPETIDLTMQVTETALQRVSLEYNNFGSRFVGYDRPGLGVNLANLTGNGDVLSLRGLRSIAEQGTTLANLMYTIPVSNDGTRVGALYSNSAYAVGRELQILDIRGNANVYGVFFTHPLERSSDFNLDLQGGLTFQDIYGSLLGTTLSRDNLRGLSFGATSDWGGEDGRNFVSLRTTQDLGTFLGGMAPNDPLSSRQAGGGYNKWNIDIGRIQRLNRQSYMILRGSHQFAFMPLPTADQYSVGGVDTVRGYRQGAYLGDGGYGVGAEFRFSPFNDDLDTFQLAAFIDHGGAYLKRPLPGEIPNVSLTGAGFGFRLKLGESFVLRADLGFPIGDNAVTRIQGNNPVPYINFINTF